MSGTLALFLDIEFSFDDHINRIATTNVYHLKSISMVKKFLPQTDSEKVADAFISSSLDYCNALCAVLSKLSVG